MADTPSATFDDLHAELVHDALAGDLLATLELVDLARDDDNAEQIRRWLTVAVEQDDTQARYELGVIELRAGDAGSAYAFFTEAAEDGIVEAMYELGILDLASGNTEDAQAWLVQAAEEGHAPALELLRNLNHAPDEAAPDEG